ncbi:MAG: hypothetical protein IKM03_02470 [Alistipes sp.]|nr:hypothetical protein [Alistipes sp.]
MKRVVFMAIALLMGVMSATAQEAADKYAAVELPHKIENVVIEDAHGESAMLPLWGEKNLLIFYVDPDKHSQNHEFTVEMEEKHLAAGENIYGLGVLNLKDTWLPNGVVRSIARKRTEKNGATIMSDTDRVLAQKWGLGDCNNKFVLLLISKEGELVFCRKGEFTEQDKKEFLEVIQPYR